MESKEDVSVSEAELFFLRKKEDPESLDLLADYLTDVMIVSTEEDVVTFSHSRSKHENTFRVTVEWGGMCLKTTRREGAMIMSRQGDWPLSETSFSRWIKSLMCAIADHEWLEWSLYA